MGAHALLIGISRFDDPKLAKLNSPQSDVEAFAGVLKDPARGAFDSVTVSIDDDLLKIRDQLSALMDGRSPDDMVLLYYSGHGIVAKGQRLYLATGQSAFDKPQARSLATSEIRDLMEQSRAGRLVVILDCCHSGVFAEGAKGAEAPAMTDTTFGDGEGSEGQYVLTATDALQYAYDGTGALRETTSGPMLSRFTRWLVDGIGKGEAAPYDERITLDSLYQYLCRRARAEQAGMNPQRFVKRGSGDLVIARNPSATTLAVPDQLMAQLDSPDWHVRKDAVAELTRVAKQARMGPLVRKAILDRVSDERDVDVRDAMVHLLERLGHVDPEPSPSPSPPPPPPPPPPTPPQPPPPPPRPQPEIILPRDDWQTKVLVKSGVATSALTGANGTYLLMELQRRASGLRAATYMYRAYIAGVIFVCFAALGQAGQGEAEAGAGWMVIMIGFGIAGLVNRKTLPAASTHSDTDILRLQQAIPLIEARWGWAFGWSKHEYEANLYHRACWWMLVGGVITLVLVLANL